MIRAMHVLMPLSMQFPPPGTGWGFVTEGVPKMHPWGLNFWLIPYKSLQIPYMQNTVEYTEYTKAPPLGQESGSKDALITTIAQKGGDCIDRCTTTAAMLCPIWSMTERSKFRFRTLPFSIDGCSLAPLRGASGILTLHCTLQQAVVDGLGLHLCVHHHVEVGFSQKAAMRQHSKVQITHGTNST